MFGVGRLIKERFPDRQIYHKSDGRLRYFAVTTEMQVGALLIACSVAVWLTVSIVDLALSSRAQLLLERRIASEQDIESEGSVERSVDEEYASVADTLSNMQEAVREVRSQLTREQLDLARVVAERERLRRIIALSESDAQAVVEIFRLENKRAELKATIKSILIAIFSVIATAIVSIFIYIRQSRDIRKVYQK